MLPRYVTFTLGGIIACLILFVSSYWTGLNSVVFDDVHQAYATISKNGFRCVSDRADGNVVSGFMIAREPITWMEINEMPKIGKMGPEWRGKVWVTDRTNLQSPNLTMPRNAKARLWGRVFLYGDEELLKEIELAMPTGRG